MDNSKKALGTKFARQGLQARQVGDGFLRKVQYYCLLRKALKTSFF